MSGEILSGVLGGTFGYFIGKFLGRFRLWKVFVTTFLLVYVAIFMMGLVLVGFNQTASRFHELLTPSVVAIFCGFSTIVTFVALVGNAARRNVKKDDSEDKA
jgi:hypothetical protein